MWWHSRVTAICLCLQVIAQTSPALIYQISSQRRSRQRLNWLLKSPWEQKCQRRTLATSGTCVIRCVCSLFATVTVMAMTVVCCKHRLFCASSPFVTGTLHSWICFWMFSLFIFSPIGGRDFRIPGSALRLPEEQNDGNRSQPHCNGGGAGWRPSHLTCRWVGGGVRSFVKTGLAVMMMTLSHFPEHDWWF